MLGMSSLVGFEGVNLFPLGKDTMVEHVANVDVYQANKVRGRAGDDGGQIAFHFNASENVKFEIDTILVMMIQRVMIQPLSQVFAHLLRLSRILQRSRLVLKALSTT